jgi:DNA-binding LacI/PurR family transcriptional regulator
MISIRDLARTLELSHTTVSDALRNNPRVRRETRERVLKAAKEAGYRYNPLAGALMSEMRRSGTGSFHGVLAVVDLESAEQRLSSSRPYHREVFRGAKEKGLGLGFKTVAFVLGSEGLTVSRLDSILKSRGIHGLLILPAASNPDISNLEWDVYAGIYTDYIIEKPALDSVCSDHFRSMVMAMRKLEALGYRRPGLVLHSAHDQRLLNRWEAAYRIQDAKSDKFVAIEPLVLEDVNKLAFKKWFNVNNPDVVLCHRPEVKVWMESLGARIPETHGFCCLNVMNSETPVSGLDLRPRLIGSRGMELLVGQMRRNVYGVPETASTMTIPAQWIDGPTMRKVRS